MNKCLRTLFILSTCALAQVSPPPVPTAAPARSATTPSVITSAPVTTNPAPTTTPRRSEPVPPRPGPPDDDRGDHHRPGEVGIVPGGGSVVLVPGGGSVVPEVAVVAGVGPLLANGVVDGIEWAQVPALDLRDYAPPALGPLAITEADIAFARISYITPAAVSPEGVLLKANLAVTMSEREVYLVIKRGIDRCSHVEAIPVTALAMGPLPTDQVRALVGCTCNRLADLEIQLTCDTIVERQQVVVGSLPDPVGWQPTSSILNPQWTGILVLNVKDIPVVAVQPLELSSLAGTLGFNINVRALPDAADSLDDQKQQTADKLLLQTDREALQSPMGSSAVPTDDNDDASPVPDARDPDANSEKEDHADKKTHQESESSSEESEEESSSAEEEEEEESTRALAAEEESSTGQEKDSRVEIVVIPEDPKFLEKLISDIQQDQTTSEENDHEDATTNQETETTDMHKTDQEDETDNDDEDDQSDKKNGADDHHEDDDLEDDDRKMQESVVATKQTFISDAATNESARSGVIDDQQEEETADEGETTQEEEEEEDRTTVTATDFLEDNVHSLYDADDEVVKADNSVLANGRPLPDDWVEVLHEDVSPASSGLMKQLIEHAQHAN